LPGADNISNRRRIAALVHAHQGGLRAFLNRMCRNEALADDLAQETFLRAFNKLDQLNENESEKAWIYKIGYRIFLDYIRKEKRRKDLGDIHMPQPEAVLDDTGIKMDVEQAMNNLPASQRAAVMLCLAYGFSHSEAATALNQPLGTVKSHVNRGKDALRGFLTAYERA
jgi:RNA polymerase sigma-70 factor (ECF subfamily)